MLGKRRLAATDDRFAQAWHAESGGKCGAKARVVDEGEGSALVSNPPMRQPPEMMITMALQPIGDTIADRLIFGVARSESLRRWAPRIDG